MDSLRKRLETLVKGTLEGEGFELVDLIVRGSPTSRLVQFFVDREGGVTVDDCVHLNRSLSTVLDTEDLNLGSYRLEVSSPGVARPLKTERDFSKNAGRRVSVSVLAGDGKERVEGVILRADSDSVYIQSDKETVAVPFSSIVKASVALQW